jgi:hypothetical protein
VTRLPRKSDIHASCMLLCFLCEDLYHVGHLHTPKCILQKSDINMIVWIDQELTEDPRDLPRKQTEAMALSILSRHRSFQEAHIDDLPCKCVLSRTSVGEISKDMLGL